MIALVFVLGAVSAPRLLARPKTDIVVMKNGDRITCEIVELERGQLRIKTDYTLGTTSIDWSKVERIESSQFFQVEFTDGSRHTGTIELGETDEFRVTVESDVAATDQPEVVTIDQLGRNFVQKLDGGLDFGLSATSNNSQRQFTVNATVERRTEKNLFRLRGSSIQSHQTDGTDTNRHNASFLTQRFFAKSWLAGSLLEFLQSDEQQLDLRTTAGGFAGRHFLRSDKADLVALGGAVINRERFSPDGNDNSAATSAEGILGARASVFRFDATEFNLQFLLYPSITDLGRIRTDLSTDVYWEIWGDLYLRVTFFHNFDSRPAVEAPSNDLGVTTSVGWSF